MERFDIGTLLLATVLISLLLALTVGVASLGRGLRVLRAWAAAMLLHGIAYLLLALRGQIPDVASIVVGNVVLSASFATILYAIAEFRERAIPRWCYWLPPLLTAGFFSLFIDDQTPRLVVAGLIYGAQQIFSLYAVFVGREDHRGRGHLILTAALAVVVVVVLARSLGIALGLIQIASLTSPGTSQALIYLMALSVPLLGTIGFLIMALEGTDRRIRASKHQLDALFDSIEESLALVHRDGCFLAINRTGAQRLGRSPESLAGRPMAEVIPAEVNERRLTVLRRVLDSGRVERFEDERLGRRMRITFYPVEGGPDTAVMHGSDVTESHAAEEALRNSEARYRALFENSHTVMLIIDPADGRIVDANGAAGRYYGWSPETLRTMRIMDINVLPIEEVKAEMAQAKAARRDYFLFRHRRADGSVRDVEVFSGPIRLNGHDLLYSIVHDISDRQHGMRRTQALLDIGAAAGSLREDALIQRGVGHAVAVTQSAAGCLYFVGKNGRSLEHAHALGPDPDADAARQPLLDQCLREGRPVTHNEADGEVGGAAARRLALPVIEDGRPRMILGVAGKDEPYGALDAETVQLIGNAIWRIVRRERAELEAARALAEQRELNRKLEDAHNQLLQSEKMASIGQLAAGVAHEINNPVGFVTSNLGTLDGYVTDLLAILDAYERAEQAAADRVPELREAGALRQQKDLDYLRGDLAQLLQESRDGLARVRKIVADLKDFSRVGDTNWQWADLHQGLESTLNVVWNELKYKCTVRKDFAPDLPRIRCLPSQLNQVFMNLLVNAAHAITVKDGQLGEIAIATRHAGPDAVAIVIRDSGSGIPPDHIPKLFDPFFTTKPVGKGTGLGLSIAWGIVQRHHGAIAVDSTPGVGTTFTITLPVDPAPEAAAAPAETAP